MGRDGGALGSLFQPPHTFMHYPVPWDCSSLVQLTQNIFERCKQHYILVTSHFWHVLEFGACSASEISLQLYSFVVRGFWMPAKRVLFPVTSFLGYGLFCKTVHTTWLILTKSLSSELEKVLLNKVHYVPVPPSLSSLGDRHSLQSISLYSPPCRTGGGGWQGREGRLRIGVVGDDACKIKACPILNFLGAYF